MLLLLLPVSGLDLQFSLARLVDVVSVSSVMTAASSLLDRIAMPWSLRRGELLVVPSGAGSSNRGGDDGIIISSSCSCSSIGMMARRRRQHHQLCVVRCLAVVMPLLSGEFRCLVIVVVLGGFHGDGDGGSIIIRRPRRRGIISLSIRIGVGRSSDNSGG